MCDLTKNNYRVSAEDLKDAGILIDENGDLLIPLANDAAQRAIRLFVVGWKSALSDFWEMEYK